MKGSLCHSGFPEAYWKQWGSLILFLYILKSMLSDLFSRITLNLPLRDIIKMAAPPIFHLRNGHWIHRFSSPTALPCIPPISKGAMYRRQMQGSREGYLGPYFSKGKQSCTRRINIFLHNLIRWIIHSTVIIYIKNECFTDSFYSFYLHFTIK